MSSSVLTAPQSFARAITNDPGSVLSRQDARNLVDAAVGDIARASSLERAYGIHERNLKLIAAAAKLPRGDASTLRIINGYEQRGNEALQNVAAALGQLTAVTDDLRQALKDALQGSLGIQNASATIMALGSNAGKPQFSIEQAGSLGVLKADITVKNDSTPEVVEVRVRQAPALVDAELAKTLQSSLANEFGLARAEVQAVSALVETNGAENYVLAVQDPTSNQPFAAITYFGGSLPSLGSFTYSESVARELALPLAAKHIIELAQNGGPVAVLEATMRVLERTPASLEVVDPQDSPVGFDPTSEVQFAAESLWGDIGVYVTVNKQSGALRVEDYN